MLRDTTVLLLPLDNKQSGKLMIYKQLVFVTETRTSGLTRVLLVPITPDILDDSPLICIYSESCPMHFF